MQSLVITAVFRLALLFAFLSPLACSEKDLDPNDPAKSFAYAREPYDDENWEIALQKLGEFKSRFPYSKYAALAELMLADCHFELDQYEEAASAYSQFVKLHPKHEKAEYAMYRIGESYWVDAPEAIDRDQAFTMRAIEEWEKLLRKYPNGEYSKKASEQITKGQRRIAESYEFVAKFYCKLEIQHACAYRSLLLSEKYPQYPDLYKNSLTMAAKAFDKLADEKAKEPESDKNIYFKTMSAEEIRAKAKELRQKLASAK